MDFSSPNIFATIRCHCIPFVLYNCLMNAVFTEAELQHVYIYNEELMNQKFHLSNHTSARPFLLLLNNCWYNGSRMPSIVEESLKIFTLLTLLAVVHVAITFRDQFMGLVFAIVISVLGIDPAEVMESDTDSDNIDNIDNDNDDVDDTEYYSDDDDDDDEYNSVFGEEDEELVLLEFDYFDNIVFIGMVERITLDFSDEDDFNDEDSYSDEDFYRHGHGGEGNDNTTHPTI